MQFSSNAKDLHHWIVFVYNMQAVCGAVETKV